MDHPDEFRMPENNPAAGASLFMDVKKEFPKISHNVDWDSSAWSINGKYIAYVVKSGGSDWKTIRIKNLETMKDLDDEITKVKFSSPSWDIKCEGFFYSRYDDAKSADGKSS
jgi:protease II